MQSEFVEKLGCELTREEQLQKGTEMALLLQRLEETESEAKSVADGYKRDIKKLERTIGDRAEEVRTGIEHRLVECTERGRFREGLVDVIRTDTGEVVRTRPMTEAEKQQPLPFGAEHQATRQ